MHARLTYHVNCLSLARQTVALVMAMFLAGTGHGSEPLSPRRSATPTVGQSASVPVPQITATFSIVAVDPESGVCGAAVASKYPDVGKVVPFARGGVGAFCTQYWAHSPWGPVALELLEKGKRPEEVITELLDGDRSPGRRQLAVIDAHGRTAVHNPYDAEADGQWWGAMAGRGYACQGNTLAGRKVVVRMARVYETTEGSLADRLMAALVAGDRAGGDHRGRLAAGIRVAKPGVEGYWLELYVDQHDDAVESLAREFARLHHDAKAKPAAPPSK